MTWTTAFRLISLAVLVASAGCGPAGHTAPLSDSPVPSLACRSVATVTEADSGHTYCISRSARLEVYLHGTPQDRWPPITLEGDALRRIPSGKGMLGLGVTGGFFIAAHLGTASLTSTRHPCPRPGQAGTCGSLRTVTITIIVR
jgi:hypothetical protein